MCFLFFCTDWLKMIKNNKLINDRNVLTKLELNKTERQRPCENY